MECLGAWGTLIHEKKLRSKISCQTPFKQKENYFRSEANTLARKNIVFEAKRTRPSVRKLFSKLSEHIRQKENYFRSEANTLSRKIIIFKAKRTFLLLKNLKIEAKRRQLILNCKSSKAKGTQLLQKIKLSQRSELVYFKT